MVASVVAVALLGGCGSTGAPTYEAYLPVAVVQDVLLPGDVDGDGVGDLVVLDYGADNDEDGFFTASARVFTGPIVGDIDPDSGQPWVWATPAGDLDGDGDEDLAAYDLAGNVFVWLLPHPSLAPEPDVMLFDGVAWTADLATAPLAPAGDLTGDGQDDVVVPQGDAYAGPILSGIAPLGLVAPDMSVPNTGWIAPFGDVSGDSVADLVTGGGPVDGLRIQFGPVASGQVLERADLLFLSAGFLRSGFELGDLDGDGMADVLLPPRMLTGQEVYYTSLGPLRGEVTLLTGAGYPDGLNDLAHLCDLDGDGQLDLLVGVGPNTLTPAWWRGPLRPTEREGAWPPDYAWDDATFTDDDGIQDTLGTRCGADISGDGIDDVIRFTSAAPEQAPKRRPPGIRVDAGGSWLVKD